MLFTGSNVFLFLLKKKKNKKGECHLFLWQRQYSME